MKKIMIALTIALPCLVSAQDDENANYTYKGLIRASSSFGTGFMTKNDLKNVYITGDLEYYLNNRISVRGETYAFLNSLDNPTSPLLQNHQLFSGASYHFRPDKSLDFYVGLQPGIAYSQTSMLQLEPTDPAKSDATLNPLVSGITGINYFATRIFHLFINARYVSGKHLSNAPEPMSLNEFRIQFGLGINFRVLKEK